MPDEWSTQSGMVEWKLSEARAGACGAGEKIVPPKRAVERRGAGEVRDGDRVLEGRQRRA